MAEIDPQALDRAAEALLDHMRPGLGFLSIRADIRQHVVNDYRARAHVVISAYLTSLPPEVPDWGPEAEADTI